MATRALQQVVTYVAWDTVANAYKTGDVANHSTSWEKDGTRAATTNSPAEVDATNLPGLYKVTVTSTETDCIQGVLGGKSSGNTVLIPTMVSFIYANTSAPATAGIPDVNAKNIGGDSTAATALKNMTNGLCWGTCSGGTTTTAVVSTLNNPSSLTDAGQLIGRTIIFLGSTATGNVQSQASTITNSTTGSTPTITFVLMTHAPANGDTFVIV